jgi:hypothetical protein
MKAAAMPDNQNRSSVMAVQELASLIHHEVQYSIAPASKQRVHQGREHMSENLSSFNPHLLNRVHSQIIR